MENLISTFRDVDTNDFPDFYSYRKPLERGLWVLWVCKERLQISKLNADQVAGLITEVKEISTDAKSVSNAFNRAKDKLHIHMDIGKAYFEIMKPGKDYLLSLVRAGSIDLVCFEPNKKFTSRILSKNLFSQLKGELKVVDPYCGLRALEMLKDTGAPVKFLTQLDKLRRPEKKELLQSLPDFKSEFPQVEIKDYHGSELHDRYVISDDRLIVFGHSIKDLGSKESFAVNFKKDAVKNIWESLIETFNQRWGTSTAV